MQTNELKQFTRDKIKSRLLKKAAELWGYHESDMEAFDSLVMLLFEACSVEFEKVAHEIHSTQHRVIDRLASLMNPDLDLSKPAYGIMQVRPVEPVAVVRLETQFVYRRPTQARGTISGDGIPSELFFSPVIQVPVVNGTVRILANSTQLYCLENGVQKTTLASAGNQHVPEERMLWVGLELDEEVKSLNNLSFYFDWQNDPAKELYYPYLPFTRWFMEGQEIPARMGYAQPENREPALEDEFDLSFRIENQVLQLYNRSFVTLLPPKNGKELKPSFRQYPAGFETRFSTRDLNQLKQDLVWIRVQFPESLPPEALQTVLCTINSFPVVNRQLHRLTYKLQQSLNIIPLESSETFLTVKQVSSTAHVRFRSIPLVSPRELETETFTLRYGVNRFDNRDAAEWLNYLLELLRDESTAFSAIGEEFLSSNIRELNQNIARLEQKVQQHAVSKRAVPYLVIKPRQPGENVYVEYWTTHGEAGNRIPAGNKFSPYSDATWQRDSVFLLTTTFGGKARLGSDEKINACKKALLTRERIVTLEDIKVVCQAELGSLLRSVTVRKGFMIGGTPNLGFLRCIQVLITASATSTYSPEEWQKTLEALQVTLESRSSLNLPFQVSLDDKRQ